MPAFFGRLRRAFVFFMASGLAAGPFTAAQAQPSLPWTPSEGGRHAIELLVDDAGLQLPTTQWPLPRAAVQAALDGLPATLSPALAAALHQVRRELQDQAHARGQITLRNRADGLVGFGDDATPGSSLAARSEAMEGPHLAAQLGGRLEDRADADRSGARLRLDDSALVTEVAGLQLQAWSHRSWWSPGWDTALALGNNAPALNAIGVQRASASRSESPWLSWLGPWNFELFVAGTEGISEPAHPFFIGGRVTMRPFQHVELALTKTAQWGGRGRPQSVSSFFKTFFGIDSNVSNDSEQARDPGNNMAGFDLRARCPSALRCAGYLQLIGEDQVNHFPAKYLGLYGMEWWTADGAHRFIAEYAETGCRMPVGAPAMKNCAYRNYAYPQGYVSDGRWLGASAGPDSRLLTLGWIGAEHRSSLRVRAGRIGSRAGTFSPGADDPRHAGRAVGLAARRAFTWGGVTLTPQLDWLRVRAADGTRNEARVGLQLSWAPSDGS